VTFARPWSPRYVYDLHPKVFDAWQGPNRAQDETSRAFAVAEHAGYPDVQLRLTSQ
jgi:hypothetical protein